MYFLMGFLRKKENMENVKEGNVETALSSIPEKAGNLSGTAGRGLLAGLVGTAAITLSQMIDMKLTGREPSETPVQAAGKVIGFEAKGEEQEEINNKNKLNQMVHFAYGTLWGEGRAAISSFGLSGWKATTLHFTAIWATALIMLPSLKVAPPVKKWGAKEIAKDALHHAIYATAAGLTFDAINKGKC